MSYRSSSLSVAVVTAIVVIGLMTPLVARAAGPRTVSLRFGEKGTAAGELESPSGVAVSEAGEHVFVVDQGNDRVERFSTLGDYEAEFDGSGTHTGEGEAAPTGKFSEPEGIAVDNSKETSAEDPSVGDVYVVDRGHDVIDKYTEGGKYLGQLTETGLGESFGEIDGVAVDPHGNVWVYSEPLSGAEVARFSNAASNKFDSSCQSPYGAAPGFAVDGADDLYVNRGFRIFAKLTESCEVISEAFVGEAPEASAAAVDPADNVYVDNLTSIGLFTSEGAQIERFGSGELEGGAGIGVHGETSPHFPEGAAYVASKATDEVLAFAPEQPGAPSITHQSVSQVTSTSAVVTGSVDPRGADTHYVVRYGVANCATETMSCASQPLEPGPDVGNGYVTVSISPERLEALTPGTTYHAAIVANNSYGTSIIANLTFVTQSATSSSSLPDDRGYELVSPENKNGGNVVGIDAISGGGVTQAAANGEAVTFLTYSAVSSAKGAPFGSQYLARHTASGWSTEDIDGPTNAQSYVLVGLGTPFKEFSTELTRGIEPNFTTEKASGGTEDPQLSPEAPANYQNLFVRELQTGKLLPVMSNSNSTRTLPPGDFSLSLAATSEDLQHVVFYSDDALLPGTVAGIGGIYEWTNGALSLLNLLPGETEVRPGKAEVGSVDNVATAVSNDGSRVAFTQNETLYARIGIGTPGATTVQVDGDHGGGESGGGVFVYANTNMSTILFTDRRKLTADATAASEGLSDEQDLGDLYSYDVDTGELTDLTVDASSDVNGANVVGFVGASTDGSYVYFVANGRLAERATKGNCLTNNSSSTATCNLYVEHNNVVSLVSQLSGADNQTTGGEFWLPTGLIADDWAPKLLERTVRVSPDGQELLFMSHRDLTGYDNSGPNCLPVEEGEPTKDEYTSGDCAELYLYSATTHHLACISCNMSGAAPQGPSGIPAATGTSVGLAYYQSRALTDAGKRVFFESADTLSPRATRKRIAVYEWEADEVGSCHETNGCVFLISGGGSNEDASFVDASADGDNVFFLTSSKLVEADGDQLVDIYDARVGGGTSSEIVAPACASVECERSGTPSLSTEVPGSTSVEGSDNFAPPSRSSGDKSTAHESKLTHALKLCKRKRRKKPRQTCEKQARYKYKGRSAATNKKTAENVRSRATGKGGVR